MHVNLLACEQVDMRGYAVPDGRYALAALLMDADISAGPPRG